MKKLNWFKPSKYGFDWYPASWQGLLIYLFFLALIIGNLIRINTDSASISDTLINFLPQTAVIYAIYLLIISLLCGRPHWRWNGKMLLIYSTFPNRKSAIKICKQLVKEQLIACANINQIESCYTWEEKIMESEEVTVFLKTTTWNFRALKKRLTEIHPYERPCILKISATANHSYFNWLESVVNK